ncbi:MAG: hypothetical protein BGN83_12880 [Rhizobium sp. 63-7]|nr:MAG: hypothetical protein BGN83_12880 [Rhizobium sp. 63-7]
MAQSFKTIGFLDMLKGLPLRLFRSQAETERDKALNELFTRNDPHLLDDIGFVGMQQQPAKPGGGTAKTSALAALMAF